MAVATSILISWEASDLQRTPLLDDGAVSRPEAERILPNPVRYVISSVPGSPAYYGVVIASTAVIEHYQWQHRADSVPPYISYY